jgi:parvulin-like peptidyl-prolyl isomerase
MPRSILLAGLSLILGVTVACKGESGPAGGGQTPARDPGAPPEIDRTSPLPEPLPDIAATVNGHAIPIRNVKVLADSAMFGQKLPPDQKPYMYRKAMHQFIIRQLLFDEAVARGLTADQKRMDAAENEARAPYGDDKAFNTFLSSQGMDLEAFKTELRTQFTVNALTQQEADKIQPDGLGEEELKRYYDEHPQEFTVTGRVRTAHIFVRVPPDIAPARRGIFRTKAEGYLAQIRSGADFAAIAKKHSEDPATRNKGGEMEVFANGQLPPQLRAIEHAVQPLKPGEVSDVIDTAVGMSIVKLLERLPDEVMTFDKAREPLRHHLVQKKRAEALQALVNGLRAKAKIETRL